MRLLVMVVRQGGRPAHELGGTLLVAGLERVHGLGQQVGGALLEGSAQPLERTPGCHPGDEAAIKRELATWQGELGRTAEGWLGATYGRTDDGEFVGVVRFESREAAERNSARPEQDVWWRRASACFPGEVSFHDCDEVTTLLDRGADEAGSVQVIEGRVTDRERFLALQATTPVDLLREQRPEIIGGTLAVDSSEDLHRPWFASP